MFKVHKIGANNLSVKNMVLLFFTIVFGFASVITLAQITIPSVINNAWQTIGRVTITQSGTEDSPLYRDFNYDGNGSTMVSGLDEKGPFSGRVLGIDDNGNIIFAYSNNLLVSVSSGYRTGDGTDIRNTNIGNVGIGTDTPNMGKIHIVNSGSTDIYIQELKNGDAASMRLQTQKGTWIVGGDSNPEVFFIGILTGLSLNEQHQEYFTVTPLGDIGIGTTTPVGGKVHILNSGSAELYLEETKLSGAANIYFKNPERTRTIGGDSDPDYFYIGKINSGADFVITPDSNVGIGLINPTHPFEVYKNSRADVVRLGQMWGNLYFGGVDGEGNASNNLVLKETATDGSASNVISLQGNNGVHGLDISSYTPSGNPQYNTITSKGGLLIGISTGVGTRDDLGISFVTQSNQYRLKITSGGNVGIGTTNPTNRLEVTGTGQFNGLKITSLTSEDCLGTDSAGNVIGTGCGGGGGGSSYWNANGSDIYNSNAGNVGIGRIPNYKLDVEGNINIRNNGDLLLSGGSFIKRLPWDGTQVRFNYEGRTVSGISLMGDYVAISNRRGGGSNPSTGGHLYVDGNVGIGTTTPSVKLEINGNVLAKGTGNYDAAGDTATLFLGDTNAYIRAAYGLGLRFGTFSNPDILAITHGGSVGIGTINPANKLHVTGTGQFSGLRITSLPSEDCLGTDSAGNVIGTGCGGGGGSSYRSANGSDIYNANAGNVQLGTNTRGATLTIVTGGRMNVNNPYRPGGAYNIDDKQTIAGLGGDTDPALGINSYRDSTRKEDRPKVNIGAKTYINFVLSGGHDVMRLVGNNVGIGTDDPQGKLHVSRGRSEGDMIFTGYTQGISPNQNFTSILSIGPNYYSGFRFISRKYENPATPSFRFIDGGGLPIYISANGLVNALYITTGHKIGLGTNTPAEKLEVNGNMRFTNSGYIQAGSLYPNQFYLGMNGRIGIGTNVLDEKLNVWGNVKILGGYTLIIPNGAGDGKVLTSDANGNASRQTPAGGVSAYFAPMYERHGCNGNCDVVDLVSSSEYFACFLRGFRSADNQGGCSISNGGTYWNVRGYVNGTTNGNYIQCEVVCIKNG